MDAKRLEELKEYVDEYVPLESISRDLLALIDAEIARQSVTDEAVQRAILWIESGKADGMRDWDNADQEWKCEPGAKEMHEDFMSAFDLAITALRQYQNPTDDAVLDCSTCIGCDCEPELGETVKGCKAYVKREQADIADAIEAMTDNPLYNADIRKTILTALRRMRTEPDCSTAEWQGGYCLGYGKSDTDDEPCEVCKACPKQANYDDDKCEWIVYHGENWLGKEYRIYRCSNCRKATAVRSNFCPSCGARMVK